MNTQLLDLLNKTLQDIDDQKITLSSIIRQSTRIARLGKDYHNLWWLKWEMCNLTDITERDEAIEELIHKISKEEYEAYYKDYYIKWGNERKCVDYSGVKKPQKKSQILSKSVSEIEADIESFENIINDAKTPEGLHPIDIYYKDEENKQLKIIANVAIKNRKDILAKIKKRVHEFLSHTEVVISFGVASSDVFDKNRKYVDSLLKEVNPVAFAQISSAYERLKEGDEEARSQAITSCRRALKSLSDQLYPPTSKPVIGGDGSERILNDKKYINRLIQYIIDETQKSTSGELVCAQVKDIGNRLEKLYRLSSKGVHSGVDDFEVNQCIIQTYLIIGDILRIYAKSNE